MKEGRRGGSGPVLGLALLGGASGAALVVTRAPFGPGELVAVFAIAAALGPIFSLRARLRRARDLVVTSAVAAAAGVLAFFAVPLAVLAHAGGLDATAAAILLGGAPVAAALIAAGGSSYLARRMRKARLRRVAYP